MEKRYYRAGEFAQKATVSLRTLRFYDRKGLLSPASRTESGYRLYAEEDLLTLQQILALKFLGFSLEEIGQYLKNNKRSNSDLKVFASALIQQREMFIDRRNQIDTILKAIAHTEELIRTGQHNWGAIVSVITGIQGESKNDWIRKYFRPDQLQKLDELYKTSYSPEALLKLQAREWTAEDQEKVSAQWAYLAKESDRLAAANADPVGEEGQRLAALKESLLRAFTGDDPEIEAGLKKFWENHHQLAPEEQPLAAVIPDTTDAGSRFIGEAEAHYRSQKTATQAVL